MSPSPSDPKKNDRKKNDPNPTNQAPLDPTVGDRSSSNPASKEDASASSKLLTGKSGARKRKGGSANPILELLLAPTYWPVALFEFAVAWVFTRQWLTLVAISPMVFGFFFLTFAALQGSRITPIEVAGRYLSLSEKAKESGDDKALSVLYRKLLSTPLEDKTRFEVANFLVKSKRLQEAMEQFQILAPLDRVGYGPAHLVMARSLATSGEVRSPSGIQKLRHHSQASLKALPDNPEALVLAAQVANIDSENDKAVEYLEQAAKAKPEYLLALARLYGAMGKKELFSSISARAESYFASLLSKSARDLEARIGLIQAKLFNNKGSEAVFVSEEGLRFHQDRPEMLQWVILTYLHVYDAEPEENKGSDVALQSLERILALDPNNLAALERIAALVSLRPENDWAKLESRLKDALASGKSIPTIHVILANGQLLRKQYDLATFHLEQALAQNPKLLTVLNNLAWIESNKEPPDLDRALQLINQATAIAPRHPEILETKGTILLKQQKYAEAITCLEPLIPMFPKRAELRLKLADAYDKMGDTALADKHRKQAELIGEGKP